MCKKRKVSIQFAEHNHFLSSAKAVFNPEVGGGMVCDSLGCTLSPGAVVLEPWRCNRVAG